jgi:multidrug efflux pump
MMSARLLRHQTSHGRLYRASERIYQGILSGYGAMLRVILKHPAFTVLVLLATISVNIYLFAIVPKGFFPEQDTGRMMGMIRAREDISFQAMRAKVTRFMDAVISDPAVSDAVAFTGGAGGSNVGRMFVGLKDLNVRKAGVAEVMARIRRKTANVPGAMLLMQPVQDIRVGGRLTGAQYQYTLQTQDLEQLNEWAPKILDRLRKMPQLSDVNTDQENSGLAAWLTIDRDTASRLGLSVSSIDNAIYDAFGQRPVSTMYTELNQYHVVMEVAPRFWQQPDTLKYLYVHSSGTRPGGNSGPGVSAQTDLSAAQAAAQQKTTSATLAAATSRTTSDFSALPTSQATSASMAAPATQVTSATLASAQQLAATSPTSPALAAQSGSSGNGVSAGNPVAPGNSTVSGNPVVPRSAGPSGNAASNSIGAAGTPGSSLISQVGGYSVPLSAFTRFAPHTTPIVVNHQGQFPSVTISFNLQPGVALGDAVNLIDTATRDMNVPATLQGSFTGTAEAFQSSLANEPVLILTALIAVYIVLGILYESYMHPITILSTLPSAGVGALLALLITRQDLTIIALIGIILLIGIVKKNAIMMIDFALDAERREGKSPRDAIYEACMLRFRPITMTTMAALLGALPLALGTGMGSELRRPLGITIVGGLIFSQALTLFTTPVIYLELDRLRWWVLRLRGRAPARAHLVEG